MPISEPAPDVQFDDMQQQVRAGLMGMWVFLITELLLFGGLFAAFAIFRVRYAEVFAGAAGHLDLTLAAINTVILLTSGLTMALAEQAVSVSRRRLALAFLAGTILLGLVFLGIKGYEWFIEYSHNLMPVWDMTFDYPGDQPEIAELFFNFYFAMTGLHALHMLIGLAILAVLMVFVYRWRLPHKLDRQAHVMGLYWAFVDVVWIFVFTTLYLLRG